MSEDEDFMRQTRIARMMAETSGNAKDDEGGTMEELRLARRMAAAQANNDEDENAEDDALMSEGTKQAFKKAGALAAIAGRWGAGKAKAAALATAEKASAAKAEFDAKRAVEAERKRLEADAKVGAAAALVGLEVPPPSKPFQVMDHGDKEQIAAIMRAPDERTLAESQAPFQGLDGNDIATALTPTAVASAPIDEPYYLEELEQPAAEPAPMQEWLGHLPATVIEEEPSYVIEQAAPVPEARQGKAEADEAARTALNTMLASPVYGTNTEGQDEMLGRCKVLMSLMERRAARVAPGVPLLREVDNLWVLGLVPLTPFAGVNEIPPPPEYVPPVVAPTHTPVVRPPVVVSVPRAGKSGKTLVLMIGAVVLLAAAGGGAFWWTQQKPAPNPVPVVSKAKPAVAPAPVVDPGAPVLGPEDMPFPVDLSKQAEVVAPVPVPVAVEPEPVIAPVAKPAAVVKPAAPVKAEPAPVAKPTATAAAKPAPKPVAVKKKAPPAPVAKPKPVAPKEDWQDKAQDDMAQFEKEMGIE